MNRYYKEKELSAVRGKIQRNLEQSNFVIRNKWKVIGFGILVSFWAPTYHRTNHVSNHYRITKTALEISELPYYQLVILTAVVYTLSLIIGQLVWKYQDEKRLKQLQKREQELVALLENL